MAIAIAAALGAALCRAFGSLVSFYPAQALGAMAFNRARMLVVTVLLCLATTALGTWVTVQADLVGLLVMSGLVGIFLGDTALFATLRRMGPRRTSILFAMNAPIATVLGFIFLSEYLDPTVLIGCGVVLAGVLLAIVYGKRKSQLHRWESVSGPLWAGIAFGLVAATAQACGLILSKPALDAGVDPIAASAIRVGIAACALLIVMRFPVAGFRPAATMTGRLFLWVVLSAFLGTGLIFNA